MALINNNNTTTTNNNNQLPCGGDGVCMICHATPSEGDRLSCTTCATPWHATCLSPSARPGTLADTLRWECPDCTPTANELSVGVPAPAGGEAGGLVAKIRAIEADLSLSDQQKAVRRQELLGGKVASPENKNKNKSAHNIHDDMNCRICMQILDRPVTTPCGHNFCLKCFQKWVAQGNRNCPTCRGKIPAKLASQPRINDTVVAVIRMLKARQCRESSSSSTQQRVYHSLENDQRPDKAFTTERAQKGGIANAASGKIFVTVPHDHFGPILAENDPERNLGVIVGETWENRLECRQWGAHRVHISGISGQSRHGAQSVVLSGGYADDEDHGEWFLYTGSGGKNLDGNKRTNKDHSFDQEFTYVNEALRVSCRKGYPVRVIRSCKEKRSSYAPVTGIRYDGIYRIEKCWRKPGSQGFKVCRYLFVRCDNSPAPWTSDSQGDRPRPMPAIQEMNRATDVTERAESPSWDFVEEQDCWKWTRPPPPSKHKESEDHVPGKRRRRSKSANKTIQKQLLRDFGCPICRKVLTLPVTTPCAHNFCKSCLEGAFKGKSVTRERSGSRSLRTKKNIWKCPACPMDISDYLQDPQVNRELTEAIESLKAQAIEDELEDEDDDFEERGEEEGAPGGDDDEDDDTIMLPDNVTNDNKRMRVNDDVPSAPKRRGRPPKNRGEGSSSSSRVCPNNNQNEEMKVAPKRRGRPPKNRVEPQAEAQL